MTIGYKFAGLESAQTERQAEGFFSAAGIS